MKNFYFFIILILPIATRSTAVAPHADQGRPVVNVAGQTDLKPVLPKKSNKKKVAQALGATTLLALIGAGLYHASNTPENQKEDGANVETQLWDDDSEHINVKTQLGDDGEDLYADEDSDTSRINPVYAFETNLKEKGQIFQLHPSPKKEPRGESILKKLFGFFVP